MADIQIEDRFKLVDVNQSSIYKSILIEYINHNVSKNSHRLINNYNSFDFDSYIKVFAIFEFESLVSFSCIQEFSNNQWRIATRLWTDPKYRSCNMLPSSWNGKYLMPAQIKWIENQNWTNPFVFWSREPPISNLPWTLKKVNRLTETLNQHVVLEGFYNTGKNFFYTKDIKSCWQKIIYVQSDKFSNSCKLPHMSDDNYEQHFKQN